MGVARKQKKRAKKLANRELSWLWFNRRVQMEADHPANPLLERAKFLAIVSSNLSEFLQVRYHGICVQAHGTKPVRMVQGGITARSLYRRVNREILHQENHQYLLFGGIRSELYLQEVQLYPIFDMTEAMREKEASIFRKEIKPNLKRLTVQAQPQQKQLYLLIKLVMPRKKTARFVTLAMPTALPRLYDLSDNPQVHRLIRLEDIVRHSLGQVFPREKVELAAVFRVIRNQNFPLSDSSEAYTPMAVRNMLRQRRTGRVVRLEAEERMSEEMLMMLMRRFALRQEQRYRVAGPLDLNRLLMNLYGLLQRNDLKYPMAEPAPLMELMGNDLWKKIAAKDTLLYHPYQSFAPVEHFLQSAARDPAVKAVKQTLYRVSGNSPIVQALMEAAENGKEVVVLFEAYARFDEENNLFWGERLQRAGCRVIFGVQGLKTHSKITLVDRVERGKVRRYLHLGTGNYHEVTAKVYTDFGLLTADQVLAADAHAFFMELEGVGGQPMRELVKAPERMKPTLLSLIRRERDNALAGKPSGIVAKMNSLSDKEVIAALYDASRAGVPIRLIVRGICCLLPGIRGCSETIQVLSIVGRHLEHARVCWFLNGGERRVYLSSADWMHRNLDRRVEAMFPVKDEACMGAVENVLSLQLRDNQKAWRAKRDGSYERVNAGEGEAAVNAQEELLHHLQAVLAESDPRGNLRNIGEDVD